ncbi:MAG: GMC family oxidoreductase [Actinobacteria bacterium]|nr:GMC family oxidoreductase [Actinomycetota bacterium]
MTDVNDYDVLIVGSGFGGSVAALRLVEKGYRVGVIEAGRRFADDEFAKTSWRLRKFLFAPKLGLEGIQRIHFLRDVVVLAGAGVGGGSLVYANTLYVPPETFFKDRQWAGITDWRSELMPYYEQAKRMLGVVQNPTMTPADVAMKEVAQEMGVGETFTMTPVGVYFGTAPGETVPDPYFGGVGPDRKGCIECGECMTGCRHNAKNTLVKNYLGLAEQAGVDVMPRTTVRGLRQVDGGWAVDVEKSTSVLGAGRRTISADQVIMAAGTYNTQKLLHRMKDTGHLPKLSNRLGRLSRTNSESLLGAIADKAPTNVAGSDLPGDFTRGVAITSSFYPEPHTHVEPVRYGKGSNAMGLLGTILTDEEPGVPRWKTWAKEMKSDPKNAIKALQVAGWSQKAVIALVMQTLDNSVTVSGSKGFLGRWKLTSRQGDGDPNPTWIPAANKAVRILAEKIKGFPMGNMGEVIGAPMTAHFVGGCVIGDSAETGVIDAYHRAYGNPGLHIVDGSAVSANLGVNPSLTITAQAERAMALWPNKGERDPRPPLGEAYLPVAVTEPNAPVVPPSAPAALRLPIVEVKQSAPNASQVR